MKKKIIIVCVLISLILIQYIKSEALAYFLIGLIVFGGLLGNFLNGYKK